MPYLTSREQEIVAYDYFTDLKHSSYFNIYNAADLLGISPKEITRSIRENTYASSGHYFKIADRKSFKKEGRRGGVKIGKIKSV